MASDDITIKILMQSLEMTEKIQEDLDDQRSELVELKLENVRNHNYRESFARFEDNLKQIQNQLREESETRRKELKEIETNMAKKTDVTALMVRMDSIEKTHAKWVGALGVIGLLLGYFSSAIKSWLSSMLQ
jgi:putative heme degradation protein